MDKLRAMRLFVWVLDAGSFTAVADDLNVTTSMISKEIRHLEEELGVCLMHRSTRGQQLTAIGENHLQRCRELLIQMDDADAYVQHMESNPRGICASTHRWPWVLPKCRAFTSFNIQGNDFKVG